MDSNIQNITLHTFHDSCLAGAPAAALDAAATLKPATTSAPAGTVAVEAPVTAVNPSVDKGTFVQIHVHFVKSANPS